MLSLEKYMSISGESRRNVFRKLADGRLLRKKIDGELYIINPSELDKLNDKQKLLILEDKKQEWNSMIILARENPERKADVLEEIKQDVAGYVIMGFKVVGYNEKTLYKKISTGKIDRKTRSDKSTVKNSILSNPKIQETVMQIAEPLYYKDARGSLRLLVDRIIYRAKQREDLYEIAAIPFPTLYRFLSNKFAETGAKESHLQKNHFDQWNKNKPRVEGAFTSDIDFMDWLALDDHMIQTAGVKVYNPARGLYELKTVYTWFVIEAKTMMPVAYDIKVREFNANDLKLLFMKALMNVGKPVKGFLFDNGTASSSSNTQMLNYLGINYKTTRPYDPTGKATMERFFGLLNSECTVMLDNYIGGKRTDGRHSTLKLSPEDTCMTEEDLINTVDNYINGFFVDRPRTRKINNDTVKISIREYYEKEYQNFAPEYPDPKQLRYSFLSGEIKKFDGQRIKLGKHGSYYPTEALPPYLNNRYYDFRYNPLDMNEIDMYNIDPLRVGDFIIDSGKLITTLSSMKDKGNEEKQQQANKLWKQHSKALREVSKTTTELIIVENPNSAGLISNGETLVDTRKSIEKKVQSVLMNESMKLTKTEIDPELMTKEEQPLPATELSYDEEEQTSTLTFENND